MRLQRSVGNGATTRLVQTKLKVGAHDDPLEREAEAVAKQVAAEGGIDGLATETEATGSEPIARATRTDDDGESVVGLEGGALPASAAEAITGAGAGQPLPETLRRSMEAAVDADLSAVRVHTGASSDAAAQQLQARAFTTGADIHFAAGEYDPGTRAGQELLAHEVTHTVQQGAASARTIRRMPSPAAVRARTQKKEKKGRKIFGKRVGATNSFNALVGALRAHSDYITATVIASDPSTSAQQVSTLHGLIDNVVAAAQTYLAKKDAEPEVAAICAQILTTARLEKQVVRDIADDGVRNANDIGGVGNPKWYLRLPSDPRTYSPTSAPDLKANVLTVSGGESGKGQNKEVKEVVNQSGDVGFFAHDDETGQYEDEEEFGNATYLLGLYGVKGDAKLSGRSIAMSRLDKLLGAGVIARTERGLLEDKVGTFQWKAEGDQMSKAMKAGEDLDDPNLARLLSRLQLIDIIAGQVDRHPGNYFVQRDPKSGKIIGVTGIDLDMSWVKDEDAKIQFDIDQGENYYPGFSRYVDKELAERILALDPDDLRAILAGLLDEGAIEAAVRRLEALQKRLKELETQLLEPDEWTAQIRAKLVDEKSTKRWKTSKSYFGRDARVNG